MTAPASGFRVLVIEDEAMVAMLLEAMLEDLGHTIAGSAAKIEDAIRLIAETQADAAILDVNLHGKETYPLAEALKARGIPFVFATGYDSSGLREEWRGTKVLQKPFQVKDLSEAVSSLRAVKTA